MNKEYGIISEPASLSTSSNHYEMGWEFTVGPEDIRVSWLRVKFPAAQTVVGHLWTNSGELLASCTIEVTTAGEWTEAELDSAVTLLAGTTYVVSCYNPSTRYYGSKSSFAFNSKLASVGGGRYIQTQNAFPSNRETGTIYPLIDIVIGEITRYHTSGNFEFTSTDIQRVSSVKNSEITWECEIPADTQLKVFARLSSGDYVECENGGTIPGISENTDLTAETLFIRIDFSTSNERVSPKLYGIKLKVSDAVDTDTIVLHLKSGTKNSFRRAAGAVTVSYDGTGSLAGLGGPVMPFTQSFTPVRLLPKNNPNSSEHIGISSIDVQSKLTKVEYSNTKCDEHIDIAQITVTANLIHVDDI